MAYLRILALLALAITVCPWRNGLAATNTGLHFNSYRADYRVAYDGIGFGTSTTTLTVKNTHYHLCIVNLTTLPFLHGRVKECSEGLLKNNQVLPLHYNYLYQHDSKIQQVNIYFNWQTNQATINSTGKSWHTFIPNGTQDKISYQLLLRQGVANQQRTFQFPVADGGKIKFYRFVAVGPATITTPLRRFATIQLKRLPMTSKQQVLLWLAPALDNMVVKVQQQKHLMDIGTAELMKYYA